VIGAGLDEQAVTPQVITTAKVAQVIKVLVFMFLEVMPLSFIRQGLQREGRLRIRGALPRVAGVPEAVGLAVPGVDIAAIWTPIEAAEFTGFTGFTESHSGVCGRVPQTVGDRLRISQPIKVAFGQTRR
jgi:hypothetical protein